MCEPTMERSLHWSPVSELDQVNGRSSMAWDGMSYLLYFNWIRISGHEVIAPL